jgi:hypothetical protein
MLLLMVEAVNLMLLKNDNLEESEFNNFIDTILNNFKFIKY